MRIRGLDRLLPLSREHCDTAPPPVLPRDLDLLVVRELAQLNFEEIKASEVVPLGRADVLLKLRVALLAIN